MNTLGPSTGEIVALLFSLYISQRFLSLTAPAASRDPMGRALDGDAFPRDHEMTAISVLCARSLPLRSVDNIVPHAQVVSLSGVDK